MILRGFVCGQGNFNSALLSEYRSIDVRNRIMHQLLEYSLQCREFENPNIVLKVSAYVEKQKMPLNPMRREPKKRL